MTGIVKRLEQSGPIERRHDLVDRRLVKVYFTDEGRDIIQYLPDAALEFSRIMSQGFSESEKRGLQAKLQIMIASLSTVGPNSGDRFGLLPDLIRLDQQVK